MGPLLLAAALASTPPRPSPAAAPQVALAGTAVPAMESLLRQAIAERALAQLRRFDPEWNPEQRDCAGLVRFAYRAAFKELAPAHPVPLWQDRSGKPVAFADAETLLAGSFRNLGRNTAAHDALQSGDLVAFRQGEPGAEVFHLMLVVREADPAHGLFVIYHPGEMGAALRGGPLDSLAREAPLEWRPVPENPAFLGYYRFKEWTHELR